MQPERGMPLRTLKRQRPYSSNHLLKSAKQTDCSESVNE
jgi:hypothetical protein